MEKINKEKKELIPLEIDELFKETEEEIKTREELEKEAEKYRKFTELSEEDWKHIRSLPPEFCEFAKAGIKSKKQSEYESNQKFYERLMNPMKKESEKKQEDNSEDEEEKTPEVKWVRKKRERDLPPEVMD